MADELEVQPEQGASSIPESSPSPEAGATETHEDPAEALRAMREDSDRFKEEATFFRTMAMRQQAQNQTPQRKATIEKDPNEFLTAGEVKAFDDRFASIEDRVRQQHEIACESKARAKYTDFDDVVMKYTLPLVQAEQSRGENSLMNAIDRADDPAMAAYMYGRTSEAYLAEKSKESAKKVVSKIEDNLNKPSTLGASKTGNPKPIEKKWGEMSTEEWKAERVKALGF